MTLATTSLLLSMLSAAPAAPTEPLCAQRDPCRLVETLEGGKDAQGQEHTVKHLSLGWLNQDVAGTATGRKFGAGRHATGSRAAGECEAMEWWLVGTPSQLLLSTCNDGYGAAGVGEDTVRVSDNILNYEQSGGSAERWSSTRSLLLSPLTLIGENLRSNSSTEPDKEKGEVWEVPTLKGEVILPAPQCSKGEASVGARELPLLPLITLDKAWVQDGWKKAELGACALESGFFVMGNQDDPKDAALKAVLAERELLFVEVRDNRWTGPTPGDKWLADDHVELWLAPLPPQELTGCGKPLPDQQPVQWAIRVADSKVFSAYGSPKQTLKVERAEIREGKTLVGYRFKVVLPKGYKSISVLYSDSDSGKKQERLLATSPLKFSRPETLNAVRLVTPEEATCKLSGGALTVVPTPLKLKGPDVAALQP